MSEKQGEDNGGTQQHKCDKCGESYDTKRQLKYHNLIHSRDYKEAKVKSREQTEKPGKNFRCDTCGKCSYSLATLKVHLRSHTKERPFKCQYCPKSFSTSSYLIVHTRLHTGVHPYRCVHCPQGFISKERLDIHVAKKHTGDGHQCPHCPKRFFKKATWQLHQEISHLSTRSHICHLCGKAFSQHSGLKAHLVHHERLETGLGCKLCTIGFTTVEQLDRHNARRHGKYGCPVCSKSFPTEKAMMTHQKYHDRTMKCSLCPASYVTGDALEKHQRLKHWQDLGLVPLERTTSSKAGRPRTRNVKVEKVDKVSDETGKNQIEADCSQNPKGNERLQESAIRGINSVHSGEEDASFDDRFEFPVPEYDTQSEHGSFPYDSDNQIEPNPPTKEVLQKPWQDLELNQLGKRQPSPTMERPAATNVKIEIEEVQIENLPVQDEEKEDGAPENISTMWVKVELEENGPPAKQMKVETEDHIIPDVGQKEESQDSLKYKPQRKDSVKEDIPEIRPELPIPEPGKHVDHGSVPVDSDEQNDVTSQALPEQELKLPKASKKARKKPPVVSDPSIEKQRHPCDKCAKTFETQSGLDYHRRVHPEYQRYACPVCEKQYFANNHLKAHIRTVHKADLLECDICGKRIKGQEGLRSHKLIHENLRKHVCPLAHCERSFNQPGALWDHKRMHHPEEFGLEKPPSNEHICELCGKKLKSKQAYAYHVDTHRADEDREVFQCETCSKTFKGQLNLAIHVREVHQNVERKFQCDICFKFFKSKRNLRLHDATHTQTEVTKNFRCNACDKDFRTKPELRDHMDAKHETNLKLSCGQCDMKFKIRQHLYYHVKTRHSSDSGTVKIKTSKK